MGRNLKTILVLATFLMSINFSLADTVNVYINNNNERYGYMPQNSYSNGNILCTEYGGICANSRYIMTTSRVRYAPPNWKRLTIRERKLLTMKERR